MKSLNRTGQRYSGSSYDKLRGTRHQRGYGNKWDRAAKQYLKSYPDCKICGQLATCVDHIKPHNMDMRLFWNKGNWQSLCHSCHNAKTSKDKTGKNMKGCDEHGNPIDPDHPWHKKG